MLLSGGLDSSANLALCDAHDLPVLAITARYGQKAAEQEVIAARKLCLHYGIKHEVLDLTWLGRLGGSSLTEASTEVPELIRSELDEMSIIRKSAKSVWVPNRNGVLINVAASFAERMGASRIIVGFNREEAATFPDNSQAYLEKATEALNYSTSNHVEVYCYSTRWDKREIVTELKKLARPFPFEMLWSCYLGGEKPCGTCESCQRSLRALSEI